MLAAVLLGQPAAARAPAVPSDEGRAAALFDRVAGSPPRLRVFLRAMPKGGDLHNHLGGGTYAEDFIRWGAADGYCAVRATLVLAPPPCAAPASEPLADLGARDAALYSALVDSLSTRDHALGVGADRVSGHDDFFVTFDRFWDVARNHVPDMIAAARVSAAANRVTYVELMSDPAAVHDAGAAVMKAPFDPADLDAAYRRLVPALPRLVAAARQDVDARETVVAKLLGCRGGERAGPCAVTLRYQVSALRDQPPAYVFGQLALGFALAAADPRYVGVNIVAPEDMPVPRRDFDLHMAMYRYLAAKYPGVRHSLHAGELAPGMVPPADLSDHVAKSIAVAGATRIGHGTDIALEQDAPATLARMARERIAVEVSLSSADTILGIRGRDHPLALYRAAGVPFVLATDDEGVSRSDMTGEYLRAATEQGLGYLELKQAARASLEYAFLAGGSLWQDGRLGTPVAACRAAAAPACTALLDASDKAREQMRLERDFAAFERAVVTQKF
jgi:adenosine deaminase